MSTDLTVVVMAVVWLLISGLFIAFLRGADKPAPRRGR